MRAPEEFAVKLLNRETTNVNPMITRASSRWKMRMQLVIPSILNMNFENLWICIAIVDPVPFTNFITEKIVLFRLKEMPSQL
jgi:hypothetical protein